MSRVHDIAKNPISSTDANGPVSLSALYERDEVAWLERSADMIRTGDANGLDFPHLAEFLQDMAIAQRREVKSRLTNLLLHLLKWTYQPEKRATSWARTIREQRRELEILFETKTLRRHAETILSEAYQLALKYAVEETGKEASAFPSGCPFSVEEAVSLPLDACREED